MPLRAIHWRHRDSLLASPAQGVKLSASNGKVTVIGKVATRAIHNAMLAKAREFAGSQAVIDELYVE